MDRYALLYEPYSGTQGLVKSKVGELVKYADYEAEIAEYNEDLHDLKKDLRVADCLPKETQAEISAMKHDIERQLKTIAEYDEENARLKAEIEKLRSVLNEIGDLINGKISCYQSIGRIVACLYLRRGLWTHDNHIGYRPTKLLTGEGE